MRLLKQLWPALGLAVLLLAGCGEGQVPAATLTLAEDGQSDYVIVYGENATQDTVDAAHTLQRELERITGAELPVYDTLAMSPTDREILLGGTGRPESRAVIPEHAAAYAVGVAGEKLVISAALPETLNDAVGDLCDALSGLQSGDALSVPADFALQGAAEDEDTLAALPALSAGVYAGRLRGGSTDEVLIYRADSAAFDDYLARLEDAGFARQFLNETDGNRAAAYTGAELIVTVLDTPAQGMVRVLADCDGALPPLKGDETVRCSPSVTMIGQDGTADDHVYGMSFLFQLPNGSFVIFDGGYDDNAAADRLYDKLTELALPGQPVTIAAWLMTHTHNDHVGAFVTFTRKYRDEVVLERLIYNVPSLEEFGAAGQNVGYRNRMLECANDRLYPGMETVIAHPGQVFSLGTAELEILYTAELLAPEPLVNFNDSSVVSKLTVAGQSFLLTGDCSEGSAPILLAMYDTALECDVLQVAHHGYAKRAVPAAFYQAVDPAWVLWPSSELNFERSATKEAPANAWLLANVAPERICVARGDVLSVPLPME